MMKVLVTGSLGYIGSALCDFLLEKNNYRVIGLDSGYFEDCAFSQSRFKTQHLYCDIRHADEELFMGADVVVHMAALSNDPLGTLNEKLTYEINYRSAVRLASLSKDAGVKRFIFLSTQSIYGISTSKRALKEDDEKFPQTAYARSKLLAEDEILRLNSKNFSVVVIRPATVFGFSRLFRSDIVFNNLLCSAYLTEKIMIKSDGTPWRPIININDLCLVIEYFIREITWKDISKMSVNVGLPGENLQVLEIANAARQCYPKAKIEIGEELSSDERSYQVSFERLTNLIPENVVPKTDLILAGNEMLEEFAKHKFVLADFNGTRTNRLNRLNYLIASGRVNRDLIYRR